MNMLGISCIISQAHLAGRTASMLGCKLHVENDMSLIAATSCPCSSRAVPRSA